MAIDTQDKRIASIGFSAAHRAGTRRPTAASSAFLRGSGLGVYVIAASVAYETARHTLYGTSLERHTLTGTPTQRHTLYATSAEQQTLSGATP